MLKDKNIVITGCLTGIGRQTLESCAENGANVFACAIEKTDEYEQYCAELSSKFGVVITPVYFDCLDDESIKTAAKEIVSAKKEIHGIINIAGINRDAYFGMITARDMNETFQVNFFSQIIFTQYIAKIMIRKKTHGSIAFISSVSAIDGNAGQVAYSASKAALLGAMRSMSKELGEKGIRVNAVAPGVIDTPMTKNLSAEIKDQKIKLMDIKRLGCEEEVANTFVFLMSDLSSHITGQTLRVDGGMR